MVNLFTNNDHCKLYEKQLFCLVISTHKNIREENDTPTISYTYFMITDETATCNI